MLGKNSKVHACLNFIRNKGMIWFWISFAYFIYFFLLITLHFYHPPYDLFLNWSYYIPHYYVRQIAASINFLLGSFSLMSFLKVKSIGFKIISFIMLTFYFIELMVTTGNFG